MTEDQKKVCRALFALSYESGFNLYPIRLVAKKVGMTITQLYDGRWQDEEREKGILWPFHPAAKGSLAGFLSFSGSRSKAAVGIGFDTKDLLAHWCGHRA